MLFIYIYILKLLMILKKIRTIQIRRYYVPRAIYLKII